MLNLVNMYIFDIIILKNVIRKRPSDLLGSGHYICVYQIKLNSHVIGSSVHCTIIRYMNSVCGTLWTQLRS